MPELVDGVPVLAAAGRKWKLGAGYPDAFLKHAFTVFEPASKVVVERDDRSKVPPIDQGDSASCCELAVRAAIAAEEGVVAPAADAPPAASETCLGRTVKFRPGKPVDCLRVRNVLDLKAAVSEGRFPVAAMAVGENFVRDMNAAGVVAPPSSTVGASAFVVVGQRIFQNEHEFLARTTMGSRVGVDGIVVLTERYVAAHLLEAFVVVTEKATKPAKKEATLQVANKVSERPSVPETVRATADEENRRFLDPINTPPVVAVPANYPLVDDKNEVVGSSKTAEEIAFDKELAAEEEAKKAKGEDKPAPKNPEVTKPGGFDMNDLIKKKE